MRLRIPSGAFALLPLSWAQSQTPPLVDYHQHLFSPAIVALASAVTTSAPPHLSPVAASALVAQLDAAGIRRALVLSVAYMRSEEHTSELQSLTNLVCRLLLEKKKKKTSDYTL